MLRSPRLLKDVPLLISPARKGILPGKRNLPLTSYRVSSVLTLLYYSLTPLLGYWLCAFLLIRYKKQVQNTTPSSPQHVPGLYRETSGSKGLNIPLADPGVRLDCESFLLPSFCILEKSLAGSLSFLIYSLTVISASHMLRFFIIANTFHSYILELINGCTICLHLSEGNNCAILRSSCALLTLIHWL